MKEEDTDTDYQHCNPKRYTPSGCMLFNLILILPTSVILAVLEWGINLLCGRFSSLVAAIQGGVSRGRIFATENSVCGEMRVVGGKKMCCCLHSVRCGR